MTEHKCPPEHKHGASRYCYITHGCRCRPCRDYAAEQSRKRRRLKAYGRPTSSLVDAAPMQEHLRHLREFGYGYRRLEQLTGVGQVTIRHHLDGRRSKVQASVADRVMRVHPSLEGLAPGTQIPVRGVQRRLWALRRLGWTSMDVARVMGCEREQVAQMLNPPGGKVTVRRHLQVAEVYNRLSMSVPEVTGVRKRVKALAAGHPGPLDWDDIDNDPTPVRVEPEARMGFVDDVVVELACNGQRPRRLSHAETRLVIRELHSRQFGDPLIAERAGISDREAVRIRKHELGLPAVAYGVSVHRRVA